jgi:nucleoside-diphosphate kinase
MKSYPVVAMLWEGIDAATTVRTMIGITKAREAAPGTIRGDFAMSQQYNLIHASESPEAAERERAIMFDPSDVFDWEKVDNIHVYLEEERKK